MQIPVNFNPRQYQKELIQALEWGVKLAVICWARRGGKDFTCFAYACKKMIAEPMNVVLVFPTKAQGKKAFWDNIENDGFKTLDHIPSALIARQDNTEMTLTLANGSNFILLGATDPDALRGANGKIYIFSEFVDIPKGALDVIRPIVRNNGGQIIINSTPKIDGVSGGSFKSLFDRALKNWTEGKQTQFASLVTAEAYLSAEELEEARQEAIEDNGNDFFYRQEYLCDFGQASASTYYGQALNKMDKNGQIGLYRYNPDYPVYTIRDLGMSDSLSIVFFQYYLENNIPTVRIIDFYETSGIGNEEVFKFLQTKPYNYAWHFFPHDGSVRDSDAIPRIEKHRELGLINSSLLTREGVDIGIERVVSNLPHTVFHQPTTVRLLEQLYLYKRKYNPLTGNYIGPEHNTASHAADAVRYVYAAIEQEFNKETCEMFISQASQEEVYEIDEFATSFFDPYSC